MQAPKLSDIQSAELKFARSMREVRMHVMRGRTALRNTAVQPSVLVAIAAMAGVVGYKLTSRKNVHDRRKSNSGNVSTSVLGLATTFLMRQAIKQMPYILQQFSATKPVSTPPAV